MDKTYGFAENNIKLDSHIQEDAELEIGDEKKEDIA